MPTGFDGDRSLERLHHALRPNGGFGEGNAGQRRGVAGLLLTGLIGRGPDANRVVAPLRELERFGVRLDRPSPVLLGGGEQRGHVPHDRLLRRPLRGGEILFHQQRGQGEDLALVVEPVAHVVGGKGVAERQVHAQQVADGVVVLGPVEPADRDAAGVVVDVAVHLVQDAIDPIHRGGSVRRGRLIGLRRRHRSHADDRENPLPLLPVGPQVVRGTDGRDVNLRFRILRAVAVAAVGRQKRPDGVVERSLRLHHRRQHHPPAADRAADRALDESARDEARRSRRLFRGRPAGGLSFSRAGGGGLCDRRGFRADSFGPPAERPARGADHRGPPPPRDPRQTAAYFGHAAAGRDAAGRRLRRIGALARSVPARLTSNRAASFFGLGTRSLRPQPSAGQRPIFPACRSEAVNPAPHVGHCTRIRMG